MWQSLKSDLTEFVRAAGEEGGSAIATLDKKLNDLDDKLNEVTGGNSNEEDDVDYTGGDANDIFVGQVDDDDVSPPDLTEISDAAMNVGKTAASFLSGVGEKVGGAATSMRMHQSMGRPPFVMTAVEDDDDEYVEEEEYSGEDDEEEEELGWSESDEEEEVEEDSGDDEVDFTNEGTSHLPLESLDVVKMRESLKKAEEERNQCMQLVEDRNQEICKIKLALDQSTIHESSFKEMQSLDDLRREVLWSRKLIAVTRQEESPTELKSILSEMRDKISNEQNVADLEMKIQSAKDSLATCYEKIDQSLLAQEEVRQTALKEKIGELETKKCALQNEIKNNRDQIAQLKVLQHELEDQSAGETVKLHSPSSSTSSGVLI
eukprot:CAMPEP_0201722464 /NCGR_PEP_ID=MMETSP0593-20130828/6840_1 /ASSEMBLY_ACC=CAM_ASM_000672 /TAXON_ID=267983 /ORGANISM="Skeletonema japonicum, Strain CCMP2506" /LENGTH=375 /DNA_ID=CAMNT_0048213427 /DNA_START=27 /DNA_END=1154 /DNA_ORIENTATION=-